MIITDEKFLRTPCEDVLQEEVGHLRSLLEMELANSNRLGRPGIGLAAIQIGIPKKFAIIRLGKPELEMDLVNCKISQGFDPAIFKDEGCLSFPDRTENTMRFQEVHIVDNLVSPERSILTGLIAVCAQHELDHMDGILLSDRKLKPAISTKIGPNESCFCGIIDSNTLKIKKYKKCHGK